MFALRLSAVFLVVAVASGAATAGGAGFGLVEAWNGALKTLCVAALVGFVVSFLIGLDRSALVKR